MDKSTTLPLSQSPNFGVQATAPMLAPVVAAPSTLQVLTSADDATCDDAAPSRQALLQRAAELGPQRLTLDNILMAPTDPVLAAKIQPRVAERRARFRRVVKVALGACAGFCLIATAATALSSTSESKSTTTASTAANSVAPASVVSSKETFEVAAITKADKTAAATPTAPLAAHKAVRSAKRR